MGESSKETGIFLLISLLLISLVVFLKSGNGNIAETAIAGTKTEIENQEEEMEKESEEDIKQKHFEEHKHVRKEGTLETYQIENLSWSPRVFVIRKLLTDEMVEHMIELGINRLSASEVAGQSASKKSSARSSTGAFIQSNPKDKLLTEIEQRIADVTHIPKENQEAAYLLRYQPGQQYKPHFDYFDPAYYEAGRWIGKWGQRCATILMFLRHPEEGGETIFPKIGLEVMAGKGDAVLFYDTHVNGTLDPRSLHGGKPIIKGEKMIATKWIREHQFTFT